MKTSTHSKPLILFTFLIIIFALPTVAQAGNGTFRSGEFNFCVSVRFNATAAQLTQIRTAFQNASQILADATDGQHRFGTVAIVNDSGASQSAEYWVNPGGGRAYATYGQYGVRGQHAMLFFDSDFQGLNAGPNGDAYTIAHEHAHHAYSVADEYAGPGGAAECAAPPDTPAMNFCLMDNYFTRGGNAGGTTAAGYTLNEFCVSSNHDPDADTNQESFYHQSCWVKIAAHPTRSAAAPAGLPVSPAPAAHAVTFENGTSGLRVVLVLDRSGSMGLEDRLVFAKQGANQFIDLLSVGDSLAVVSFDDTAAVNFSMTTISGGGTKLAAQTAVNLISLGGNTNIGGGLQAALAEITAPTDHSCNNVVVLLSDGDHNTGPAPATVIPGLQEEGVTVLSVGLGAGISPGGQATLQNVANQTGGRFYRVSNAADLVALFTQLSLETTGSGLLARSPLPIASGEVKEVPILVEAGSADATFAVTFANVADNLTLTLRSPSGTVITQADAGSNPNVEFVSGPLSRIFRITAPEPGTWTMVITAGAITNGNLQVLAFAGHDGVELNLAVFKDVLTFPEAVELHATPRFGGEAVVGAVLSGRVIRPNGSTLSLNLFDDGLPEHADEVSGDGNYSARFNQFFGNGTYTFDVTAVVVLGITYSGEDLFSFQPSNANMVPDFTRSATTTAVVTGVPDGTDMSVSKTGPPTVISGSDITYTIVVSNLGTTAATDVTVTDTLPVSVSFVSCSATAGGTCGGSGNSRSINFPSLAGETSATVVIVATANCPLADGSVITNSASVIAVTPDPNLNNNSTSLVMTNVSNPPPVITEPTLDKTTLWPANHKLIDVAVNYTVTDNCGPVVCTLSVTSNEPVNGLGDGDTSPDWEILDSHNLRLRAERSGNGSGRIYSITTTCVDSANNVATKTSSVLVPKSMKGGSGMVRVTGHLVNLESSAGGSTVSAVRMFSPLPIGVINFNLNPKPPAIGSSEGENLVNFILGDLEFKALNYDFRELSGARTQFKGFGKVNNEAGYKYLLTVIDGQAAKGGGVDKFRLKIWNDKTGEVVFDNQTGDGDDADPTTPIADSKSISFPK